MAKKYPSPVNAEDFEKKKKKKVSISEARTRATNFTVLLGKERGGEYKEPSWIPLQSVLVELKLGWCVFVKRQWIPTRREFIE